jgi:choline dehydrogenase-like flavoprotein
MTGLRIADASIMPDIVSSNTNAASMMIGWKAGEIILGSDRSLSIPAEGALPVGSSPAVD